FLRLIVGFRVFTAVTSGDSDRTHDHRRMRTHPPAIRSKIRAVVHAVPAVDPAPPDRRPGIATNCPNREKPQVTGNLLRRRGTHRVGRLPYSPAHCSGA